MLKTNTVLDLCALTPHLFTLWMCIHPPCEARLQSELDHASPGRLPLAACPMPRPPHCPSPPVAICHLLRRDGQPLYSPREATQGHPTCRRRRRRRQVVGVLLYFSEKPVATTVTLMTPPMLSSTCAPRMMLA